MGPRDAGFLGMRASPQPQRAGDGRYHHLVAVGANSHFDLARKIDPLDGFKKTVDDCSPLPILRVLRRLLRHLRESKGNGAV